LLVPLQLFEVLIGNGGCPVNMPIASSILQVGEGGVSYSEQSKVEAKQE